MVTAAASGEAAGADLIRRVEIAARAGVHLIQVRDHALDGGELARRVAACVRVTAGTPARVIVNDRLDVAMAAGAHGVHLRGDSMPAARARAIAAPGFLVGRSIHSAGEARQAEDAGGLDYLMFGTVFRSASKPGAPEAGTDALTAVAGATRLPVLAIGGVSVTTCARLAGTGAAGFAAIGLFTEPDADRLRAVIAAAFRAFAA
jgi:thiamine-phosphate pyrophosphorylase